MPTPPYHRGLDPSPSGGSIISFSDAPAAAPGGSAPISASESPSRRPQANQRYSLCCFLTVSCYHHSIFYICISGLEYNIFQISASSRGGFRHPSSSTAFVPTSAASGSKWNPCRGSLCTAPGGHQRAACFAPPISCGGGCEWADAASPALSVAPGRR